MITVVKEKMMDKVNLELKLKAAGRLVILIISVTNNIAIANQEIILIFNLI